MTIPRGVLEKEKKRQTENGGRYQIGGFEDLGRGYVRG